VHQNPVVQKGLTWEGFRWAPIYGNIGHWHPLTWLSLMPDHQVYGLNLGGYPLTNVCFMQQRRSCSSSHDAHTENCALAVQASGVFL
jgi:hypothetical protein